MKALLVILFTASTAYAEMPEQLTLTLTARNVARGGHCEAVPAIADRVRALDPDYYTRVFALDPLIAGCTHVDAHLQVGIPPSLTSVRRAPPPFIGERKDPDTALGFSVGVTLTGLGAIAAGAVSGQPAVTVAGAIVFVIGPTTGHIYADHAANDGLTMRSTGLLAGAVGAGLIVSCFDGCPQQALFDGAVVLFIGGGLAYVVGSLYEIGTAPEAARRYNREHGLEATVVPTGNGLALAGSF